MVKKILPVTMGIVLVCLTASTLEPNNIPAQAAIKQVTFSGNNIVSYPCLSDDGKLLLYVVEIKNGEESSKAVMIKNIESGKEIVLFRNKEKQAPVPFENNPLLVGSKPPVLSGNGRVAVFTLSLDAPANILDHYLAVINTDGTGFRYMPLKIDALAAVDLKSHDFVSDRWERVSIFSVNSEGNRLACLVKGHLGPRRYGDPSAILLMDLANNAQRTVLAPVFIDKEWRWPVFPNRPLTGGGWAFCMSGDGEKIVFGANSSSDEIDYDLYVMAWDGKGIKRITDFHDRWFSLADISHDGGKVLFYYNGKAKQGIGTYIVSSDGSGLEYLSSPTVSRIEAYEMAENGTSVFFKHIYKGMLFDLEARQERVVFDENTLGYIKEMTPMDFPRFPSFWRPKVSSFNGEKIILAGPPRGREAPEFYLLSLTVK